MTINILIFSLLLFFSIYSLYRDTKLRQIDLELKYKIGLSQGIPSKQLAFNEILEIINNVIDFNTLLVIEKNSLDTLSDEKIQVMFKDIIIDISSKSYMSISNNLKQQLYSYVNDDYLKIYIERVSGISLLLSITKKRQSLKK